MQRNNSISILVITYNRANDLLEFLGSLRMQRDLTLLEEVLILDNNSTESYEPVQNFIQENPQLKINFIQSEENLGVSRGRNKLMSIARGEWLLVLDDDILFAKDDDFEKIALIPHKACFQNENVAVFTMRIIYHDTGEVQKTAFPHKKYEKYGEKTYFLTSYFIGAAHLMKRSILDITGIYPTDFFYGMEEYDLSYRILDTGAAIAYDGEVTLRHKESPLGRQANYKKVQMQWINKSKVAWRYLPARYFFSTALFWSFQYLRTCFKHPLAYITGWSRVLAIPFAEKRKGVKKSTLEYLYNVEARLNY